MDWKHIRAVGVLIVLLITGIAAQSSATAQDDASTPTAEGETDSRGFAFYPVETGMGTFFELTLAPGESEKLDVLLANTGTVTQELRAYPSNAFTAEGGGLAIAEFGDETNGPTEWLSFEADVSTVDPGMGVETRFTLTVPDSAEPGEYVTSVVAENAEPRAIEGTDMLTQMIRYAIPIFITVPGETEASFDITNLALVSQDNLQILNIGMVNNGDVHLRPEGEIQLRDANGDVLATIPVGMGTFYARGETVLPVALPITQDMGTFDLVVRLSDPQTGAKAAAEATDLVAQAPATPAPPPPITIASASLAPGPSADNVQFAVINATISNTGEAVTNAQLSLLVSKDGDEVERFPISQSLALSGGDTEVNTRYIPLDGWSSGEWTFELLLETIEGSGAAVVIASQPIEGSITIP